MGGLAACPSTRTTPTPIMTKVAANAMLLKCRGRGGCLTRTSSRQPPLVMRSVWHQLSLPTRPRVRGLYAAHRMRCRRRPAGDFVQYCSWLDLLMRPDSIKCSSNARSGWSGCFKTCAFSRDAASESVSGELARTEAIISRAWMRTSGSLILNRQGARSS